MSMTMALPVIRVAVASPPSVFVLRNVLVGLSGVRVQNLDRWLRVLPNEGIYSEEDFECIVAALLLRPPSFLFSHLLNHLLTYLLTHLITYLLTELLTDSLTELLTTLGGIFRCRDSM